MSRDFDRFYFVSSFDILNPYLGFVEAKVYKEDNNIYVKLILLGVCKDENSKYKNIGLNIAAITKFETTVDQKIFTNLLKNDESVLEEAIKALEEAINYKEKEIKERVTRIKWEK
ncbi:MAG: hypothetical protein K6G28_03965 [Acholeplasmatales bacterium]|nr:hypothetical protein [Acholeplasmatales bacterium]